jgi:hypothetical protein
MSTQYRCANLKRRALVDQHLTLNGIDYLEVLDHDAPAGGPRQQTLLLRCLKPVTGLDGGNVDIAGGVRITPVGVDWAATATAIPTAIRDTLSTDEKTLFDNLTGGDRVLIIRTDSAGDFSLYTLRLVASPVDDGAPAGFDPRLVAVDFSFKVECRNDFDCKVESVCPPPAFPAPAIDYMARDYESFRRLMLDRLSVTLADGGWKSRSAADLGVTLVESIAYVADHLSYYQDAVAAEAYLDTARTRTSVRRHARLLDYALHDGCNARAWVCIETKTDLLPGAPGVPVIPKGTRLVVGRPGESPLVGETAFRDMASARPIVFETLHDVPRLIARQGEIPFYTWSEPECCLPKGATRATLKGAAADLDLHAGDVLILEEVYDPETRIEADADLAKRHAVRLDREPVPATDPLNGEAVVEISWHEADALPFPLCLHEIDVEGESKSTSVCRGNVFLADHGLTIADEPLVEMPGAAFLPRSRPRLARTGITMAVPYDHGAAQGTPATGVLEKSPRDALAQVTLGDGGDTWTVKRDLLNSDRFARDFVVETEDDGVAHLRFGREPEGREPSNIQLLDARCRIGGGPEGNVGAEAISRIVTGSGLTLDAGDIIRVRNPLPASGGAAPEPIAKARLDAPEAFRTQRRCVTEDDYARAAEDHPEVQKAAATLRWTGSWYTMFVTVDRVGGRAIDAEFEDRLVRFLDPLRLAGHDLEIDGPAFVPLEIVMTVCVAAGYYRAQVQRALFETFARSDLKDGRRGFFHPDNFTFNQPLYLSAVIARAMAVPGVSWVDIDDTKPKPNRFQRFGRVANDEIEKGRIDVGRLEIIRLDNDPSQPENGTLAFIMEGGQ